MRGYINKLLREGLLNEALPDVNSDVDLIYDKYFRDDISNIKAFNMVDKDMFSRGNTDTSIFKSEVCVKAHELNPCTIYINHGGNNYSPVNKFINLSVHMGALGQVLDYGGDLSLAASNIDEDSRGRFLSEFTESKIKGSIHHELLHWVDDTLNNQHIKKTLEKASEVGVDKYFKGKNINMSKLEIQGQMGNIAQLKKRFGDDWDILSFKDLIDISPTIGTIYDNLSDDDRVKWVRDLKTRMYREGLLGKNMRNW
jgi:hypothetical protein